MIASKCVYSEREENDGMRILVARFVPKNLYEELSAGWDIFLPGVAPSPQTLRSYKDKAIKFPTYVNRYLNEMINDPDAVVAIKTIASLATIGPVTLLCYEKVDTFCHRRFVKEIVENYQMNSKYDIESIWRGDPTPIISDILKNYEEYPVPASSEVAK